jgi:hypothetical protein
MGVLYNAQHKMKKHRLPGVPANASFGTAAADAQFAQMPYPENACERQSAETVYPTQAAGQL